MDVIEITLLPRVAHGLAVLAICRSALISVPHRPPSTMEYPRPELLLEPTALAKPEVAKQFIVLDARAAEGIR